MRIDFSDRTAIVTGAAQGIGRAVAEGLRAGGANLHLLDIDAEGVAETAARLDASYTPVDLSDRAMVSVVIAEVERTTGVADILVNAAGGVCGQVGRSIEEVDEADWRAIFAANVDSAFWLAQAVAPGMRTRACGRIINIASSAGLRPSLTGIQAYTAAKHALVGLTKQLSWEFASKGITVNAVAPGLVLSNPASIRQWQGYGPEGQAQFLDGLHSKRLGSADDIAAAVLFFASAAAGWITGQILSVDGGRS